MPAYDIPKSFFEQRLLNNGLSVLTDQLPGAMEMRYRVERTLEKAHSLNHWQFLRGLMELNATNYTPKQFELFKRQYITKNNDLNLGSDLHESLLTATSLADPAFQTAAAEVFRQYIKNDQELVKQIHLDHIEKHLKQMELTPEKADAQSSQLEGFREVLVYTQAKLDDNARKIKELEIGNPPPRGEETAKALATLNKQSKDLLGDRREGAIKTLIQLTDEKLALSRVLGLQEHAIFSLTCFIEASGHSRNHLDRGRVSLALRVSSHYQALSSAINNPELNLQTKLTKLLEFQEILNEAQREIPKLGSTGEYMARFCASSSLKELKGTVVGIANAVNKSIAQLKTAHPEYAKLSVPTAESREADRKPDFEQVETRQHSGYRQLK